MARRVFYSFHHQADAWRTSQVRNHGVVEGNRAVSDNDWEAVKHGGDAAIQRWIDDQFLGRSCAVVLIGSATANRKWINYEIIKAWNERKGVVGVNIHGLKDMLQQQSRKGANPFDVITLDNGQRRLSSVVKAYDPPYLTSNLVYAYITEHIEHWVEEAIWIREQY